MIFQAQDPQALADEVKSVAEMGRIVSVRVQDEIQPWDLGQDGASGLSVHRTVTFTYEFEATNGDQA